jgi:DNA polymerase-1
MSPVETPKLGARLPDPGDPRALYVIDISGYVFRAYHALPPLQSPKGEPTHAVLGVTTMLLKLVADQRPAMLAVAMDSRGKSFRHEMFEGYKATRPVQPPDLGQQIERLREIIDAYAIPVLQQEGIEADDLIATLVRRARERDMHVVIVSADKDMLQLVGDDVVMYDTGRNVVYGRAVGGAKDGARLDLGVRRPRSDLRKGRDDSKEGRTREASNLPRSSFLVARARYVARLAGHCDGS